jgi:hypothetical protein
MKKYIEQTEIMALFFRSYFLYTRIAFIKHKNDNHQAKINAYKTLMKIFGKCSKEQRIDNTLLLGEIKSYIVESQSPYVNAFAEVFNESVRFIYDNVLTTKEEQHLLERYA